MEDESSKTSYRDALNQKRKMAIRCVAHLNNVSTPKNLVLKQMRLVGDEGRPDDSGPGISRSFIKYYLNYKKSGLPKRLMFYKNGEWLDYPKDVVDLVKKDFKIKKEVVKVELDGLEVMLDFLHMYNINLKTGLQQPIAWIDEAERCFFPELFAGSDEKPNDLGEHKGGESHGMKEAQEIKLHLSNQLNGAVKSKLVKSNRESNALVMDVDVDGHDTTNGVENENLGVTSIKVGEVNLGAYIEPGYGGLNVDSVKNIFLTGMTTFGVNDSDIVDIYCSSGILMQVRLELFQKQADITKGSHGDANVRFGWLACSKKELSRMMEYGLDHNALSSSKCIYGYGIHLAAITHPYVCVPYCDVDENGIKHLVLCRVIMGNMEPLRRGTKQICPNGCEYDNGVDDIEHPKYYVVWNMNMSTHIYPEFVVSFKAPFNYEGNEKSNEIMKNVSRKHSSTLDTVNVDGLRTNMRRRPRSPWLPYPMLFPAIRSKVPPELMLLIKAYYLRFMKPSNDDLDGGVTENI